MNKNTINGYNLSLILICIILSFCIIIYNLPDGLKYPIPSYIPRQLTFYDKESSKSTPISDISYNGVPAKIHQILYTKYVTEKMYNTIMNNLDNNIDFEYYFYNNKNALQFIADNYIDEVVYTYNSLDDGPFKNDLCKYCVLYMLGGIYYDTHYIVNTKLNDYISTHPLVFTLDTSTNLISTSVIIAPPGLNIFRIAIDILVNIINSNKIKIKKSQQLLYSQELLSTLINEKNYKQYISLKLNNNNNISDIETNAIIFSPYSYSKLDNFFI
jgi:mannosyltransferase OCH1-like enzyme